MTPRFHPEAALEFEEAASWYGARDLQIAARFVAEVRRRLVQAARFPHSARRIRGAEIRFDVRAFATRGYPYVAVVALIQGERVCVAVAHTGRLPGYWRERLR